MLATRHTLQVIILLLIALIPTTIHNYLGLTVKDDFSVNNIPAILGAFASTSSGRPANWGQEIFNCHEWFERLYKNEDGKVIRLFVGKSFDHKRLFHYPEQALSYNKEMANEGIQSLTDAGKIPVTVLRDKHDPNYTAAYVLLFDGQFIENPIQHQLLNTLKLLFSPKKPMILFYVVDDSSDKNLAFQKNQSAQILLQAIDSYLSSIKPNHNPA